MYRSPQFPSNCSHPETLNSVVGDLLSVALTTIFNRDYKHEQSFMAARNVRNVLSVTFIFLKDFTFGERPHECSESGKHFCSCPLGCHQSHPGEWPNACSDLGNVFLVSVTSTSMTEFILPKCNLSDVNVRIFFLKILFIDRREGRERTIKV